jgi:GNAT superfamily N-acetyltransferase
MFKDHHYLSENLNKAARHYIAIWNNQVVGYLASITMPSGTLKNAWRGHRVVILPDFQGMGIGVRFIEAVAQIHLDEGHRFFSRSPHPRMYLYMDASPLWRPTSKNKKLRKDVSDSNTYKNHIYDNKRLCYSYEYIGTLLCK